MRTFEPNPTQVEPQTRTTTLTSVPVSIWIVACRDNLPYVNSDDQQNTLAYMFEHRIVCSESRIHTRRSIPVMLFWVPASCMTFGLWCTLASYKADSEQYRLEHCTAARSLIFIMDQPTIHYTVASGDMGVKVVTLIICEIVTWGI